MSRSVFALALLTFAAACAQIPEAETSLPLTDIAWRLTRLEGREIPVKTQTGAETAYLRLTEKGRVEGSGGCNRLFGEYRRTGGQIEFSALAATRRACISGMMEEDNFMKALGNVRSWKRQGNRLYLYDGAEKPLLEMEAEKRSANQEKVNESRS